MAARPIHGGDHIRLPLPPETEAAPVVDNYFGTKITDEFFAVQPGGDIAFMSGVLKALDVAGGWDERFASFKPPMLGILGTIEDAFGGWAKGAPAPDLPARPAKARSRPSSSKGRRGRSRCRR